MHARVAVVVVDSRTFWYFIFLFTGALLSNTIVYYCRYSCCFCAYFLFVWRSFLFLLILFSSRCFFFVVLYLFLLFFVFYVFRKGSVFYCPIIPSKYSAADLSAAHHHFIHAAPTTQGGREKGGWLGWIHINFEPDDRLADSFTCAVRNVPTKHTHICIYITTHTQTHRYKRNDHLQKWAEQSTNSSILLRRRQAVNERPTRLYSV